MSRLRLLLVPLIACLVVACADTNNSPFPGPLGRTETNVMALCGAGLSDKVRAAIEAEVKPKDLTGTVDASVERKIESAFSKSDWLRPEDRLSAYKEFLKCVKDEQIARRKQQQKTEKKEEKLRACLAKFECDSAKMAGVCICSQTIKSLAREKRWSENRQAAQYRKTCMPQVRSLKNCWAGSDTDVLRSECEVVIRESGRSLPPIANACKKAA